MAKVKWLQLTCDRKLSDIEAVFASHSYTSGQTDGYEIVDVRPNVMVVRYIEELSIEEVLIDPYGNSSVLNVKKFCIIEFSLTPQSKNTYLLRLLNPPRSLKAFVRSLSELLGFGMTIASTEIDVVAIVKRLKTELGSSSVRYQKVRLSGIVLSDYSQAKIEVDSQADAYKELCEYLNLRNPRIEKATVSLRVNERLFKADFSQSGQLIAEMDLIDSLTPFFREYFLSQR